MIAALAKGARAFDEAAYSAAAGRAADYKSQGIGTKHYNPIDVDLIRDYNEAIDEALEDAFQEARNKLRASYVPPHSKSSQTGRTDKKCKTKQASA